MNVPIFRKLFRIKLHVTHATTNCLMVCRIHGNVVRSNNSPILHVAVMSPNDINTESQN